MTSPAIQRTQVGPWRIWHQPDLDPHGLLEVLQPGDPEHWRLASECRLGEREVYAKASPLRGKAGLRYGLRQSLLGTPPPRLREFQNLVWLRRHLFLAPQPLACGLWRQAGRIRSQWLVTERWTDWVAWDEVWAASSPSVRAARVIQAAEEVARMHALNFVHHDLFPRNALVPRGEDLEGVAWLDAWAGGPGLGWRGPSYDLACWAVDWPTGWSTAEQVSFLETYRAGREAQGRPIQNFARFLDRMQRERRARALRERRRSDARAQVEIDWNPPALGR
ncbi:MAG: hypothetical protein H6830_11750 [Planctomycetes bacterium]|nr:hypothetical protein [Planctomycetota bacterium]MCB9908850.1 hypothetical protein [Planctomycetota bacterium]HPF13369.1 lipopolysaccharide kinase InaA family protein [Planctomycetota bacterium]HRV80659.1 lipopolysaccharide kinase InaA family protein [Planctomycetota bacterium]